MDDWHIDWFLWANAGVDLDTCSIKIEFDWVDFADYHCMYEYMLHVGENGCLAMIS